MRAHARLPAAALVAAVWFAAGCGKKAPLRLPEQVPASRISGFEAAVRENAVVLQFRVPARRVFPESEPPWVLARVLRRTGEESEFREVGTILVPEGFAWGDRLSFTDRTAAPGQAQVYRVELRKKGTSARARTGDLAVTWSFVPGPPRELAVSGGDGAIALSWQPPEPGQDDIRYRILRRREDEPGPAGYLTPEPLADTQYLDTAVELERTYCYRVEALVRAQEAVIEGAAGAEACGRTEDRTPPPPPSNLRVVTVSGGFALTWAPSAAADLAGYRVYRAAGDEAFVRLNADAVAGTAYRDLGPELVPESVYRYRVSAVDASPRANESGFSNEVSAVLAP